MAENKTIKGSINSLNTYHTDAYMIAVREGFEGTVEEWLASLKGEKGDKGNDGHTPQKGVDYFTEEDIETIAESVANKIKVAPARIGSVELLASKWVGETSPYSQVVAVEGVTENSQVDLTPNVNQLAIFHHKDLAFVTENEDGVVTV
jgi:hypothetical protein